VTALLSVAEARQHLLAAFRPGETEVIPLPQAAGRVLSHQVSSQLDLPLFANSSMDGFAVRAADIAAADPERPVKLRVVDDIPAGQVSSIHLGPGEAVRIMTGAPLPDGADAVVPVEDTDQYRTEMVSGTQIPEHVEIHRSVDRGAYVRPKGQDVSLGEVVLHQNTRLRPQDVGFLAMLGIAKAPVYRRPRIGLLSTGDELLPVEKPLQPGKIHDSNAYTLAALVDRDGGEAIKLGIAPDKEQAVREILDRSVDLGADLILSSAGVSVGAFDFVKRVVEQQGQLNFWRVNMRPGKPLTFGSYRGIPFIGLPGNPVSAFVGYEVFVRPALLKMSGLPDRPRPSIGVKLLESLESDGRESYLRAIVNFRDGHWFARLTGHQGSGNLRSLVQANALLIIPAGVKSLPAGAETDCWLLGDIEVGYVSTE
jgi:molybdopterin molybdotransferase